jgi:DNA-binding transcriptional ArsR family regulator
MGASLHALVEPHRRQILALVRDREMTAGEIATHFDITRPAISQHLRVLKDAGLLAERRAGTRRLYRVRPEGLTELRAWLEDLWDEDPARLTR